MSNSAANNSVIRVLLTDDEAMIRDALASLLSLESDMDIVGQAGSGEEAVALAQGTQIDVAVLDLQLPGIDGIETAAQLASTNPDIRCMIVTSHGRPGYLRRALEQGVGGFLPKTASATELAQAIRTVHSGGRYVDPQLAAQAIASGASPLTAREADVLELAAAGSPVEEIAQRAHLSAGTVRNYLSSAVVKLGVTNRHEAAQVARANGWI